MGKGSKEINRLFVKKFLFVSLLNFSIVMNGLNLQDHQGKTHYRKGLAYLKNRATTSQNQILHLQKMKKKNTLKQIITGDHPTKKKRKKGRMENHRINWNTRFKWQ